MSSTSSVTPDHAATYLVRSALTAPSLHNSQPWRFVYRDRTLELYAEDARRPRRADPDGRETLIGCGAALFNVRLAMRHLGFVPVVRTYPESASPELIARIGWGAYAPPSAETDRMYRAMLVRHTYRGLFHHRRVPSVLAEELCGQAQQEGSDLFAPCGYVERRRLADLIRAAEEQQRADAGLSAELDDWTALRGRPRLDGVPASAIVASPDAGIFPGRDFAGLARRGGPHPVAGWREPRTPGLVAVLNTQRDGCRAWLRSGQALQRVLLYASARGISAAFHTQPLEVPYLRQQVRELVTAGRYPQMILHLGYAGRLPPVPRRPVAEVLSQGCRSGLCG
ncbi:hypothetical protein [Streptomyces sp. ODS28]|uniref:Acg family FMN-binding oxidoreductase n=1 Tax=Streptomyces sp. ODS28 TaxID=3136688 RepID=UPI0031EA6AB3